MTSEKSGEKEREKQQGQAEKEREKGPEKAEMWSDFGVTDRLSQFTWGAFIVWIGTVIMLDPGETLGWIVGGAGALMLFQVAVRLVVPEFRARPGLRMVMGLVLVAAALVMGFDIAWPVVLIAAGLALLLNQLFG